MLISRLDKNDIQTFQEIFGQAIKHMANGWSGLHNSVTRTKEVGLVKLLRKLKGDATKTKKAT